MAKPRMFSVTFYGGERNGETHRLSRAFIDSYPRLRVVGGKFQRVPDGTKAEGDDYCLISRGTEFWYETFDYEGKH